MWAIIDTKTNEPIYLANERYLIYAKTNQAILELEGDKVLEYYTKKETRFFDGRYFYSHLDGRRIFMLEKYEIIDYNTGEKIYRLKENGDIENLKNGQVEYRITGPIPWPLLLSALELLANKEKM